MNINDVYPSKYLRAADLGGKPRLVTIESVSMEKLGEDAKPILHFEGDAKSMVLNKTNFGTIAGLYGDETDDWAGEQIVLFEAQVEFKGTVGPAIRVRKPKPQKSKPIQKPQPEGLDTEETF